MDSLYATSSRLKTFSTASTDEPSSSKRGKAVANLSWPLPPSHSVTPASLAAAGFYYAPQKDADDNVTCFLCHKSLGGWEQGDTALEEHVAHSVKKPGQVKKACAFALLRSGGERMQELGFSEEKDLTKLRKDTFGKKADKWWPLEGKKGYPKAAEMVAAGFYRCSAEQGDDMVRCCYCKLELKNWSQNDDPREFHQSASPNCAFFKGAKAAPASVHTQTSRAASADPDGWEELIPAVPPKKKAAPKKKAPTPSRSPSPPRSIAELEETPAASLSRSTRASSRTNPLAASTRLTRSTRASVDPTPTNGSRIIPASAPSLNLATLADEDEPRGSKSARTVKENGRVLAAKPKRGPKKKVQEVVEEAIEDEIEELRDKSDEEMGQPEAQVGAEDDQQVNGEDEEMPPRPATPKQATPSPKQTPTDIAEPMEELLLSKSPTAPPRPTKSPARQAVSPPAQVLSPAPPVASQPAQTVSPIKSSASKATQPFSPPAAPSIAEQVQEDAIEEDPESEAIQDPALNQSPQEDLSEIEEEPEEEDEEPSQPTLSYNTANTTTLEPANPFDNPFQTLSSTPAPLTPNELSMKLSDWHALVIAQALEKTQRELEEQMQGYDEKVAKGRERLCEVLGL